MIIVTRRDVAIALLKCVSADGSVYGCGQSGLSAPSRLARTDRTAHERIIDAVVQRIFQDTDPVERFRRHLLFRLTADAISTDLRLLHRLCWTYLNLLGIETTDRLQTGFGTVAARSLDEPIGTIALRLSQVDLEFLPYTNPNAKLYAHAKQGLRTDVTTGKETQTDFSQDEADRNDAIVMVEFNDPFPDSVAARKRQRRSSQGTENLKLDTPPTRSTNLSTTPVSVPVVMRPRRQRNERLADAREAVVEFEGALYDLVGYVLREHYDKTELRRTVKWKALEARCGAWETRSGWSVPTEGPLAAAYMKDLGGLIQEHWHLFQGYFRKFGDANVVIGMLENVIGPIRNILDHEAGKLVGPRDLDVPMAIMAELLDGL